LQTETDPEIIKELNELLIKASDNLNETIQNLNDVVQLNTQTNLNFSKVNIKKKIAKAMDNLSSIIKTSKAKITIAIHDDFFIDGIPAYFESILLNLMSNSIKYKQKEKNPEIKIVATQEGNQKIITFEDNGCGIDLKRHKDKIFGMYKTFHGNDDARGIGLFITKNQIEAMKGKIEIESQVGLGTNFKITFDE
jgi:signal transduction histidine kinase